MSTDELQSSPNINELQPQRVRPKNYSNDSSLRRVACRYGLGCTQVYDPVHRIKFWHPSIPRLNDEQIKSQFICNECGFGTTSLTALQSHLKRKTAWTNTSLIGCRISCLVDYKEWHEGIVTQFHKSGKHFVEFRMVNEKRWLLMRKIAFYIVQRPTRQSNVNHRMLPSHHNVEQTVQQQTTTAVVSEERGEFKDSAEDKSTEESWVYSEDISIEYAFAQSVLFKIYGNTIQETGHLTKGHVCLTESDRLNAQQIKVSLLYGELLPRGVNKALGPKRLAAQSGQVLYDLGMGCGKILVQAFLQFKNLKYVYGVEMAVGRYKIAEESVLKLVQLLGADNYHVEMVPGRYIIVTEGVLRKAEAQQHVQQQESTDSSSPRNNDVYGSECDVDSPRSCDNNASGFCTSPRSCDIQQRDFANDERVLHMECGNLFDVAPTIHMADIVMMETDVPCDLYADLHGLLNGMHEGARLLSYLDLRRIWEHAPPPMLFKQLEVNRHLSDRYPTSWSVQRGHHFYFWIKTSSEVRISSKGGKSAQHHHLNNNSRSSNSVTLHSSNEATDSDNNSGFVSFRKHQQPIIQPKIENPAMSPPNDSDVVQDNTLHDEDDDDEVVHFDHDHHPDNDDAGLRDDDDSMMDDDSQCLPCYVFPLFVSWLYKRMFRRRETTNKNNKSQMDDVQSSPSTQNNYPRKVIPVISEDERPNVPIQQQIHLVTETSRLSITGPLMHRQIDAAPTPSPDTPAFDQSENPVSPSTQQHHVKNGSNSRVVKKSKKMLAVVCSDSGLPVTFSKSKSCHTAGGNDGDGDGSDSTAMFSTPSRSARQLTSKEIVSSGTSGRQNQNNVLITGGAGNQLDSVVVDRGGGADGGGLYFGADEGRMMSHDFYPQNDTYGSDNNGGRLLSADIMRQDYDSPVNYIDSQHSDDGRFLSPLASGYRTPLNHGVMSSSTNYEEGSSPHQMLSFLSAPSPLSISSSSSAHKQKNNQLPHYSHDSQQPPNLDSSHNEQNIPSINATTDEDVPLQMLTTSLVTSERA